MAKYNLCVDLKVRDKCKRIGKITTHWPVFAPMFLDHIWIDSEVDWIGILFFSELVPKKQTADPNLRYLLISSEKIKQNFGP